MKLFFILLLSIIILKANAQDPGVEKSIFGIQTGLVGIWAYNEFRLFKPISLRTELGYEASELSYSSSMGWDYAFTPVIKLEPRWYYNLKRRQERNKKIENNTGDFLALNLNFIPAEPAVTKYSQSKLPNKIAINAMWAIRRHAGEHFCFETGLGGGIGYGFYNSGNSDFNGTYSTIYIYLRAGYTF